MQYLHHKQENLLITWGNTFYYLTIHSSPQKSTVSLTSFWQAVNLIYSRSHLYVPFMEDSNFRAGAGFTRHACKDKDSTCINQETPVSFLTFIMWPNTFFFFFFMVCEPAGVSTHVPSSMPQRLCKNNDTMWSFRERQKQLCCQWHRRHF